MGMKAKGIQNVIWAMMTLPSPQLRCMAEKKISTATAVTISGTISGSVISPRETVLPRKLPPRASTRAPMVVIAVATIVDTVATISEFQTAC